MRPDRQFPGALGPGDRGGAGFFGVSGFASSQQPEVGLVGLLGVAVVIALGVCDHLAETTGCPGQLAKMPLEGSIIPVVEDMFRKGAAEHAMAPGVDPELLATTAAWAIFGAARQWYQAPDRIPAEEMATKIELMVKPIFLSASAR